MFIFFFIYFLYVTELIPFSSRAFSILAFKLHCGSDVMDIFSIEIHSFGGILFFVNLVI